MSYKTFSKKFNLYQRSGLIHIAYSYFLNALRNSNSHCTRKILRILINWSTIFFLYRYENLSLITRRNSNFHSWSLLVVPSEEVLNRWHFGNSADIKTYINRLLHRKFLTKDIHYHGCSIWQRIRKEDPVHLRRKPRLKSAETLIN